MAGYVKDFKSWYLLKSRIEKTQKEKYFKEREIWWCSIGVNVGYEEDGKNIRFERPILIFRKFNKGMFWGMPLTSKPKKGKFFFTFVFNSKKSTVILSQLRVLSSKRLIRRMGKSNTRSFKEVEEKVKGLIDETDPLRGPRVP